MAGKQLAVDRYGFERFAL